MQLFPSSSTKAPSKPPQKKIWVNLDKLVFYYFFFILKESPSESLAGIVEIALWSLKQCQNSKNNILCCSIFKLKSMKLFFRLSSVYSFGIESVPGLSVTFRLVVRPLRRCLRLN